MFIKNKLIRHNLVALLFTTPSPGAGFPINGDGTFFGSVLNPKAKMAINPAIAAHEIQKPGLFQSFFFMKSQGLVQQP